MTCKDCICSEVCYYKAFNDEKHLKKRRNDVEKICKSFAHRDKVATDTNVGDKQIEELKADNERLRNMWAKAVSDASKAESKTPKWIPVTERLPEIPDGWAEHPEPVLYMMASTGTIKAGYYGENGTWRDKYFREYHDIREGVDADDVRCWMWQHDLPEPPKGE